MTSIPETETFRSLTPHQMTDFLTRRRIEQPELQRLIDLGDDLDTLIINGVAGSARSLASAARQYGVTIQHARRAVTLARIDARGAFVPVDCGIDLTAELLDQFTCEIIAGIREPDGTMLDPFVEPEPSGAKGRRS